MNRLSLLCPLLGLSLFGCGNDPTTARLEPGTRIVVVGTDYKSMPLYECGGVEPDTVSSIFVGDEGIVITDEESDSSHKYGRLVKVRMLTGRTGGHIGCIRRALIRAMK